MYFGKVNYDFEYLITQLDNNSGDQSARNGELYTGYLINPDADFKPPLTFKEAIAKLEPNKDGQLLRAAKPYGFKAEELPVSRDQTLPMIIAAGYYKEPEFIKRVFWANVKRGLKYQNGDTLLTDLGIYIRAYYTTGKASMLWLYPLLMVMDVTQLTNTVLITALKGREPGPVRKWLASKLGMWFMIQDYKGEPGNPDSWSKHGDKNVGSDINHTQISFQSKTSMPTPLSSISNWIYRHYRPHGIQYAFDMYHDPKTFGNPLNLLWEPIILRYFR